MTITFSVAAVMRIIFLVMLFSVAAAAYVQGWRLFCNNQLDPFDRVFGGGFLWALSLGCIWLLYTIVADISIC